MEKKGALPWNEAIHFTRQIARALAHAHSRGIIHRDIKPHNIMLLRDGTIKAVNVDDFLRKAFSLTGFLEILNID